MGDKHGNWRTWLARAGCALYGAALGWFAAGLFMQPRAVVAASIAVVGFLLGGFRWFRTVVRAVAAIHLVAGVVLLRPFLQDSKFAMDFIEMALATYVLLNFTSPALVLGFVPSSLREADLSGLPAGYEHLHPDRRRLSHWERLALILTVSVAIPLALGGAFLAIFAIPVVFGIYWIVSVLRSKRTPAPQASRRLELGPQRPKAAQWKSYWTVNSADFKDPD